MHFFTFAFVQTTDANALRLDSVMYDIQYMTEKMTKHNGNSANETWSRVPLGEPQYSMTCLAINWNRSLPADATTTGRLFVVTLCWCGVGSWGFAICSTVKTNKILWNVIITFFFYSVLSSLYFTALIIHLVHYYIVTMWHTQWKDYWFNPSPQRISSSYKKSYLP